MPDFILYNVPTPAGDAVLRPLGGWPTGGSVAWDRALDVLVPAALAKEPALKRVPATGTASGIGSELAELADNLVSRISGCGKRFEIGGEDG